MKRMIMMLLIAAVFLPGCAKIVVKKVPATGTDKISGEGVFYALPKTAVRVSLIVEKSVNQAAPFIKFSRIFAPDAEPVCTPATELDKNGNVQCKCSTSYEVKQGATMTTFGEPDPDNVYMVKFIGRGELDQSVTMTWNEAGVVTGAKSTVTNRTSDIAISALKLTTGIGTRLAFGAFAPDEKKPGELKCQEDPDDNDVWVIPVLKKEAPNSAATLISNYCAIKKKDRHDWNKALDEKVLRGAARAYITIEDLDKKRNRALGDGTVIDAAAVLPKLEALISDKLQSLYVGSKKTTPWEGAFEVRDLEDHGTPKPSTLLKIDPRKGFCPKATLAPGVKPIPSKDLLLGMACENAKAVNLEMGFRPNASQQLFSVVKNHTTEPQGERSFYYRIPAQVLAEVKDDTNTAQINASPDECAAKDDAKSEPKDDAKSEAKSYGSATMFIAQLGIVTSLPAKRNSKTLTYDLTYVESTGGLKGFTLGTTGGLDAALIDQLAGVGTGILDARAKKEAEEAAAADELNVLTRQANLLKMRDQICDLMKKYGLACEFKP